MKWTVFYLSIYTEFSQCMYIFFVIIFEDVKLDYDECNVHFPLVLIINTKFPQYGQRKLYFYVADR